MIRFEEGKRGLVLEYEVEFNDPEWVSKRLEDDGEVTVSNGFTFEAADLLKVPSKRATRGPRAKERFAEKKDWIAALSSLPSTLTHSVYVALRRHVSTQLEQKRSSREVWNSKACENVARRFTLARNSRKHCVSSRCTRSSAG